MNIRAVSNVSFSGRIIDSHVHLGRWQGVSYSPASLDIYTGTPLKNGDSIEKMIVSHLGCINEDGILDELEGNTRMLDIAAGNPKIAPLAVCQPNLTGGNPAKIEKLLLDNPDRFVGFKFHPKCMRAAANSNVYDSYMELAQKYSMPCLFHSDKTFDIRHFDGSLSEKCLYSRPEQIYELAKRHKDVPVILAHMGGNDGENVKAAVDIIIDSIENDRAKLYADISWVNPDTSEKPDIIEALRRLRNTKKGDMTDRLLFGTDAPIGRFGNGGENGITPLDAYSKVVTDIKAYITKMFPKSEADELIEKVFYKNAYNLFFPKKVSDSKPQISKHVFPAKKCIVGLVSLGVVTSAAVSLFNKISKKEKAL